MAVTHIHGENGEIIWDDRYSPIFTTTNLGKWDAALLREWYVVSRREMTSAVDAGHKVFFIGNLSKVATPDAVIRKVISDLQDEFDVPFKGQNTWLGQCFVISNPLMRGIVTAVNWMTAGGLVAPPSTAPDMTAALTIVRNAYSARGLDIPPFPDDYEFPEFERQR